ncbi:MAG: hypothetical protein methR_P3558 [Methyloprofundus sp.]|nr:MAG: hypothetical protein methR_P3558 [Methyloprofundus sp.]
MANEVFANGREIACKAASGKTICAFPDVCFTPPENPATPPGIPVPYPNTGSASDTAKGSKKVKISDKEIMLKNKSYFKTSMGDEAGCAAKKGVITSKNKGKVYFQAWSMDVKVEGKNVDRHLDMTTNNHASMPGDTPPWPFMDSMAIDAAGNTDDPCAQEKKNEQDACSQHKGDRSEECDDPSCQAAQVCKLVPYGGSGSPNCCTGFTGDHLIDVKSFIQKGQNRKTGKRYPGWDRYDADAAPTMCVQGHAASCSTHGVLSTKRKAFVNQLGGKGVKEDVEIVAMVGAITAADTFEQCSEECLEGQLLDYHKSVQDGDAQVSMSQYGAGKGKDGSAKREMSDEAGNLASSWLS